MFTYFVSSLLRLRRPNTNPAKPANTAAIPARPLLNVFVAVFGNA